MRDSLEVIGLSKNFLRSDPLGVKERFLWGKAGRAANPANCLTHVSRRGLTRVSFSLRPGDCLAVIGDNGAGKTTLLRCLSGGLTPDEGVVRTRLSLAALIELGLGFHPDLTGEENMIVNAVCLGIRKSDVLTKRDAIVAFSELGTYITRPVRTYSAGMLARLSFAILAHTTADILVIDEVIQVGDIHFRERCDEFLRSHIAKGGVAILSSHDLDGLSAVATKALWLEKGDVRAFGEARDIINLYRGAGA